MMMKRIISISSLLILLPLSWSCTQTEISDDGRYGYLTVGLSDLKDDIVMTKAEAEDRIYRLDIYGSDGNIETTVENHTEVSSENPLKLLMDKYNVVATNGQRGTAFNSPCFQGNGAVRIYAEKSSSVNITCSLQQVMFSVHFPEDEEFKSKFSLYEVSVSNGQTLTFSSSPAADDPAFGSFDDIAYFEVPADRTLTYTLKMTNADGAQYSVTNKLEQVAAAEHYHFDFRLGEREEIDGAMVLDIVLDGEYDAVFTHKLTLNFDKTYMPAYSTNPEFEPVPSDGSIPVWPLGNGTMKKFTFEAPRGIRNLIISHLDVNLLKAGLPQVVDFVDISDEERQIMNTLGITSSMLASDPMSVVAEVDITEFFRNLPISEDGGHYHMSVTAVDAYDRYVRCDFRFSIVSDIEAETGGYFRWSGWAVLKGRYFSSTPPAGMTFQYRKTSDHDWVEVDPSYVEVDANTMTYSCRINHLAPDTEYVFRSTSDKDKQDGKTAAEVTFRTYPGEGTVYNLNFDDWVQVGKAWYATDDKDNHLVWDSANEGTSDILGQSLVPTTPEETIVISNKAVRMESGELFGQFAAGNIYTGDFGSATISPPGATLDWGIPFGSRPLALRGWYRYEPVAINRASNAYSYLKGQTDFCQIQIFLTTWDKPFSISTGENRFVDTSAENKSIVAHGQIMSQDNTTDNDGNQNGYIRFTIPLQYRSLDQPSYIVISAAASRYGDYFTGGLGSTLYLDELELVYDPDELTDEEFDLVMNSIIE